MSAGTEQSREQGGAGKSDLYADVFLNSSVELHALLDGSGTIIWAGGAWQRTLEYDCDALVGRSLADLLHPGELAPLLQTLFRGGSRSRERVARAAHADGSHRWMAWVGAASPDGSRLTISARAVSERLSAEVDKRRELEHVQHAALHDPLTGLANRVLLVQHLKTALARGLRDGRRPLVAFADLDDFKQINDELGHRFGDEALAGVAARLARGFRPSDLVARIGGDEFVVVLETGDAEQARRRIREVVARPLEAGGRQWQLGVSVGVIHAEPGVVTPEEAIAAADAQMYAEKVSRAEEGDRGVPPRGAGFERQSRLAPGASPGE